MNLAPVTDVYTVDAGQSFERIKSQPRESTPGGLAYGAEPLGMDPRFALIDKDLLADDDEKQVLVNIPRYNGPKNTRVDIYDYEQNTFNVTGIPNHPQPSCVYLRSRDYIEFFTSVGVLGVNGTFPLRPNYFFVQRRFKKMFWEAQNVRGVIEVPTHEFVKIAPYICNKDNLERFCKPKWSYEFKYNRNYLQVTNFEPLLSFQSGWALLDAKRPFNQQNMMYPLAIQDYSMRFEEYGTDIKLQRSYHLNNNRSFGDDFDIEENVFASMDILYSGQVDNTEAATNIPFETITDMFDEASELALVAFSENTALQANKDVSMVQMHVPEFDTYSVHKTFSADAEHGGALDVIFETTGNPLQIEIDTPKGFPSFMMLYTEFYNMPERAGRPLSISSHPRIANLRLSFYGQGNPLIANLTQSELEYITKKNCHKNSDFLNAYRTDPICLIDLESLGLGREDVGYPSRKRLRCTVECSSFQLPARFQSLYATDNERNNNTNFNYNIQFKCVFIYENRVIEGNVNQLKINRKY